MRVFVTGGMGFTGSYVIPLLLKNGYEVRCRNEMRILLEKAGLTLEAEKGDWTDADATADHDVIVYFARN